MRGCRFDYQRLSLSLNSIINFVFYSSSSTLSKQTYAVLFFSINYITFLLNLATKTFSHIFMVLIISFFSSVVNTALHITFTLKTHYLSPFFRNPVIHEKHTISLCFFLCLLSLCCTPSLPCLIKLV